MKTTLIICSLISILLIFILIRNILPKHLDDVSPEILCKEELLKKADILFIIPKFNNKSIAENKEWCQKILSLNKTLAMHGIQHTHNEFLTNRNEEYIQEGAKIFEQCFGFPPKEFKPSQLAISPNNKKLIKQNYRLHTLLAQILHKSYHCNDTGMFPNWLINII